MPDYFNLANFTAGNAGAGAGSSSVQDGGKHKKTHKHNAEKKEFTVYRGINNRKYIKVAGDHVYLTKKR